MTDVPFNKNDRVRIKNYIDPSLYQNLTTIGNEGLIKSYKEDSVGFPMVFIEWDKNHWTYNGAPDGWTYADHFEKVENSMAEQPKSAVEQVVANFAQELVAAFEQDKGAKTNPVEDQIGALDEIEDIVNGPELNEIEKRRDEALEQIYDKLSESDAFIVIGVDRFEDETAKHGGLAPFSMRFAVSPDAEIVSEAFLSTLAADAHHKLVVRSLIDFYQDEDDDEATE